ncbi:non-homologous end joining protein Ku [Streptomyces marispadix]|uniref:Non-homologous end joining protein Ku n=1 Tax=Streptomyces marispadix TaxID=2922868 RepID=A0ABS9SVZ2_9ACTN|nr:Ku protein [Streptomyces marispadix]MCH6160363.1 Ku protein [Streptomyces marispadix]
MARPIWSGVITFGLVTVPVQLFAAVEDHAVHFHQLQRGTGDRVRNRRVNERTGKRVEYDDIVKGYDVGDGEYVIVEREELEEIAPGRSQVIDVRGFVDLEEVEPAYFSRTYYLAPRSDEYARVYRLLRTALEETGKAGVATFVMHAREYLVALRAGEDVLELHTLHWADEVRDPERELPRLPGREQSRSKELDSARQLIDAMSMDWRPEEYEDTYEKKVRQLVEAKREGKEVVAEEKPPEATDVVDLEEALRRSVDQAGSGKGRGSRSGKRSGGGSQGGSRAGSGGSRGSGRDRGGGDRWLTELSKRDLYERATEQDIQGRSRMNRQQLIKALKDTRTRKAA